MKVLNQSQPIYWTGGKVNQLVLFVKWESLTPLNEIQVRFTEGGKLIWVFLYMLQN